MPAHGTYETLTYGSSFGDHQLMILLDDSQDEGVGAASRGEFLDVLLAHRPEKPSREHLTKIAVTCL